MLQLIYKLEGRLDPHVIAEAKKDVKYGEYQVFLEDIISALSSADRPVPADILNKLVEESASWDLPDDICKDLRPE
ncbi:hypothetical protein C5C66_06985 [Rathayibacter toxicus]|uniref:Uncharacterized protein n=1 Tax=Rathayibacter toxicus TaxID=145458 RepID=A0A0C5BEP8_9MICO|nr:hypothetical protein TI83_07145 [Rathayibacter toxicus]ALS58041.1 hypothetical protein APU90_09935 [Rathayibacter toxicus]KKM44256.1 hypothetical protein VT73_10090 [Rathayibacter toxicus]PPH22473.1 hypothetical protein C5D17_06975 [Rathayibacter toxicus]PPH59367.1 hypothetical protein C5C93_07005 [Rathayibacter toxicus]